MKESERLTTEHMKTSVGRTLESLSAFPLPVVKFESPSAYLSSSSDAACKRNIPVVGSFTALRLRAQVVEQIFLQISNLSDITVVLVFHTCGMSILLPSTRKGTWASASSERRESSSFLDSGKRSRSTASTRNTMASTFAHMVRFQWSSLDRTSPKRLRRRQPRRQAILAILSWAIPACES